MKKVPRRKLTRHQTLSILMATVNGFNSLVPLAPPIAAALAELPLPRRITVDETWGAKWNRGGQILDRLLFTTCYATSSTIATTVDVTGPTDNDTVIADGVMNVNSGGSATYTFVRDTGVMNVNAGGRAENTYMNDGGGRQNVLSGGTATSVIFSNGAEQVVSGGTVISATIGWDGTQTVSGGTVTGATVENGGTQIVSGGTVIEVRVDDGGTQTVSGGAVTSTWLYFGTQNVSGGTAAATRVDLGTQNVYGGTVTATTVAGGTMNGVSVGSQTVYGGTVTLTTVSYGTQNVSGGTVTSTTLDGGTQNVYGGAVAATTVGWAAVQNVMNGTVSETTINYYGSQTVSGGTVTATTVNAGGYQTVSGGTVSSTTVNAGGYQTVSGGTVSSTTVSGGYQTVSGGTVTATTVSGGSQTVYGGTVTATTFSDGGSQTVYGGTVSGTTFNGGGQLVYGGTVSGTTFNDNGNQTVSGGTVTATTIGSGGSQTVYGGTVTATTLAGYQFVNGGTVTATTVGSGGCQDVYGGTVTATTVGSGGTLSLQAGTSATGATLSAGYVLRADTGVTLEAGSVTIANGTATNVTLNRGGRLTVSAGQRSSSTTIHSGGTQTVRGVASGTAISGGVELVSNGGTATSTVVYSGGTQTVLRSGGALSASVSSGGLQNVSSGGTATDTTVNAGGVMNIGNGAVINGTTTLTGGTAAFTGSGSYAIASLAATGGSLVQLAYNNTVGRRLTINSLSGSASFAINTDLAAGTADTIIISGGTSQNTLQVIYDPAYLTGQSVTGSATFATVSGGGATFKALATESGAYRYTPTITSATSGTTTTWAISELAVGGGSGVSASETVHTAADVVAGNMVAWRTENNNLTKRLGELRQASGEAGVWLRTYRGAEEIANGGDRTTKGQYTAVQGGYDNKISRADGTVYAGCAVGYLEGSDTYSRGSGNTSSLSLGAYSSWLGNKGHFLDVIAKVGRLRNNYTSYLNDGANTKVSGDYANWGTSLSAEYGYRRQLANNWYLEPQAELTYSRVNGVAYTASDGTSLRNAAVNSFVGRLGLAIGRHAGSAHYYGKVSLAREFSAKASIAAASGLSPVDMRQDLRENWLEFALGLTAKLDKRLDGYLEITHTTGDKAKTPWQVNAGTRWNF